MKHYRLALTALALTGVLAITTAFMLRPKSAPVVKRLGPLSVIGTPAPKLAERFRQAFNAASRPGAPRFVQAECRLQESGWARCSGTTLSPYGPRCVLWIAQPVKAGWKVLAMSENPNCPARGNQ